MVASLVRRKLRMASERKLQVAAVSFHVHFILFERIITVLLLTYFLIFGKITRFLTIAYIAFIIFDRNTPSLGGRRWKFSRWYVRLLRDYFPIKLIQKTELSPDRNYLIILHPHGVLFFAHFIAFGLDAFNLAKKGLRTVMTTLNFNFLLPFAREYFLWSGGISVSEDSIRHCLLDPAGGNLVSIIPGGASEVSHCNPGVYKIILNKRKGFCRVALQTGVPLVPTFAFGEVDTYYVSPEGLLKNVWRAMKYVTGVNMVQFGNITNSSFAFTPRHVPINIVMGEPIEVSKNETPTTQDIEELHMKYVRAIKTLFDSERDKYLTAPYPDLIIE